MFSWFSRKSAILHAVFYLVGLLTTVFIALACAFVLSQAARTAPNRSFVKNVNAVVIGATYVALVSKAACLAFSLLPVYTYPCYRSLSRSRSA